MNLKIARLTSHYVGEMTCYCYAVTPARLLIRLAAWYACLKQFCFASQALDRKVTADGIYFTDCVTIWPNLHILIGCHLEKQHWTLSKESEQVWPKVAFNARDFHGLSHHAGQPKGYLLRKLLTVHAGLQITSYNHPCMLLVTENIWSTWSTAVECLVGSNVAPCMSVRTCYHKIIYKLAPGTLQISAGRSDSIKDLPDLRR